MRPAIERFWADEGNLERVYVVRHSPTRRNRMTEFYKATLADLKKRDFATLGADGQVDYVLLRNYCEKHISDLSNEAKDEAKYASLIPFAKEITDLEEARRRM
ncbi:MAG TPA: hypothetical protein VG820_09870, partial [Fimbriimonadaceae bacterium]|nr:hypothetical protein [Fimbriimonadaceae bacterium]